VRDASPSGNDDSGGVARAAAGVVDISIAIVCVIAVDCIVWSLADCTRFNSSSTLSSARAFTTDSTSCVKVSPFRCTGREAFHRAPTPTASRGTATFSRSVEPSDCMLCISSGTPSPKVNCETSPRWLTR
jgi:hypothetical protein